MEDGSTKEEWKMVAETKKISTRRSRSPRPACACRSSSAIPRRSTSSSRISSTRTRPATSCAQAPGCLVVDKREDGGYVTPVECVGDYATFISRIRQDSTIDNGLNIWVVSDNLRKGAALNAVQIAEVLGNRVLQLA